MEKETLIRKFKKLQKSDDTEEAHSLADKFLLDFIGDDQIRREFDKIMKWYS